MRRLILDKSKLSLCSLSWCSLLLLLMVGILLTLVKPGSLVYTRKFHYCFAHYVRLVFALCIVILGCQTSRFSRDIPLFWDKLPYFAKHFKKKKPPFLQKKGG
uniref:Transmembrane protein n=1 Tax=Cacopsylla melanoneura TaxID=428564 RepID=A0A8D9BMJ7_9HEMI